MNRQCDDCVDRSLGCSEENSKGDCTGYKKRTSHFKPSKRVEVGYGMPGMFKVVNADELELESAMGWTCIERFGVFAPAMDQFGSTPIQDMTTSADGGTQYRTVLAESPRFVMFLDEEAAYAKLTSELADQKQAMADLTKEKETLDEAHAKSLGEVKDLTQRIEYRIRDVDQEKTWRREAEAKARKMEGDLGTLRGEIAAVKMAIGSQRLHEILAEAEKAQAEKADKG
jgi:hypothetical protein